MLAIPSKAAIQALLITSSVYAAYHFYVIFATWGVGRFFIQGLRSGSLPGREWTGNRGINKTLNNATVFFWPVMNNPGAHFILQSLQFAGYLIVSWMLTMHEFSRPNVKRKWVSYTPIFGLMIQAGSYAIFMPLWLAAYVTTHSRSFEHMNRKPSSLDCFSIVVAVLVGFGVPAALGCLPLSETLTTDDKLGYMFLWVIYPVWTALIYHLLQRLLPLLSFFRRHLSDQPSTNPNRTFYITLLTLAVMFRCLPRAAGFYTGVTDDVFPASFVRLMPASPTGKFETLEEGFASFFAWDELLGSASHVAWAFYELGYVVASPTLSQQIQFAGLCVGLYIVAGPAGVIAAARWAADEIRV